MVAITLGQAKLVAAVVIVVFVGLAIVSAWLMKAMVQKVIVAVVFAALALLVWSQRASLQDCADRVRDQARAGVGQVDTTCSFFGQDVTISTNGGD